MKAAFVSLPFFLILLSSLAAAPSADEAAVLEAERQGCLAYQRSDAAGIAKFLTSDYTLTDSKGQISTGADDIADARSGKAKYRVFENYDMKVRLYGDCAAVVTGKTKVQGAYDGQAIDIVVQFTDTLVKQDGEWRLAAGHVSRLKE